jgi:hypothetical protein
MVHQVLNATLHGLTAIGVRSANLIVDMGTSGGLPACAAHMSLLALHLQAHMHTAVAPAAAQPQVHELLCKDTISSCGNVRCVQEESLDVEVGDLRGTFNVSTFKVLTTVNGEVESVTPNEFERLGGKASSKKWKNSIKLLNPDGTRGITIGDWLKNVSHAVSDKHASL